MCSLHKVHNEEIVTRFEVFMVMKTHVTVFWVVTPRSDVVGYQNVGGSCCLHLQGGILPRH